MTSQSRRSFLATAGVGLFGVACGPRLLSAFDSDDKISRVGIQLYTVRSEMAKDVPGTLAKLAQIGYKELEFAGYFNHSPQDIRAMLDANGLTAPSTHVPITAIQANPSQMFAEAKTIGHEWLTVPMLMDRPTTADGWKHVAEQFNAVGKQVKDAGLRFAYHNHNMEFRPVDGGALPYDILLQNTDPALVSYEMDLYWVVNANQDPIAYIKKYPDRFKMFHVKDSSAAPEHHMMDVGTGTIDFKKIFEAAEHQHIEHYFVERDDTKDPFATAATSYKYLHDVRF